MRRASGGALAAVLVLLAGGAPARSQGSSLTVVPVYVNGERLETNALMVRRVARTLLPLRALFNALDVSVAWDGQTQSAYAWKETGEVIRFQVGNHQAQLLRSEGTPGAGNWGTPTGTRNLDAPPMMYGDKVYLPLRAAGEALKAEVRWDEAGRRVLVQTATAPQPPQKVARALDVRLELPKERIAPGEEIALRLVVKNEGPSAVTVPFRSGQRVEFEVRQNDRLVWNWAHDRLFTQALGALTVQPGETRQFEARWNGRSNEGQPLAAGTYTVRGMLTAGETSLRLDASKTLTVGP